MQSNPPQMTIIPKMTVELNQDISHSGGRQ